MSHYIVLDVVVVGRGQPYAVICIILGLGVANAGIPTKTRFIIGGEYTMRTIEFAYIIVDADGPGCGVYARIRVVYGKVVEYTVTIPALNTYTIETSI